MKRFLSLLLCTMMIITMLPLSALAEGETTVADTAASESLAAAPSELPEETEPPAQETEPLAQKTEPPAQETETPLPEQTETPLPEETETPLPEETETPVPEETETPVPETETLQTYDAQEGDFTYELNEAQTEATVTGYIGSTGAVSLVVPDTIGGVNVTAIGASVFKGKTFSRGLTLPAGLKRIEESAFENGVFTGALTLPASLETIGDKAFCAARFTGANGLVIGDGVVSIGEAAFADCGSLGGAFTLGSHVETIGADAFRNVPFTGSLEIPNSVITIGNSAFEGCTFSGTLTLGSHVESIGESAFLNVPFTGSLTIPDSMQSIGAGAFHHAVGKTQPFIGGALSLGGATTSQLISIGDDAFNKAGFTQTTGLVIPNSVTDIGARALTKCSGVGGPFTLGRGLVNIGSNAFSDCSALTGSLIFGDDLRSIGSAAFLACTALDGTLDLGEGVTEIENAAFQRCSGLTGGLVLPDSLTTLGGSAFSGCSGLTGSLTIGAGLDAIPTAAFSSCGFTGWLGIPDGVTAIGAGAFENCDGFSDAVVWPANLDAIGSGAFLGSTVKKHVGTGDAPTSILEAENEFRSLPVDATVYYPSGNASWTITDGLWQGYATAVITVTVSGAGAAKLGVNETYTASWNAPGTPAFTWSVTDGTGAAAIDAATGTLTPMRQGDVTVRATAGSAYGEKTVTIAASEFTYEDDPITTGGLRITGYNGPTGAINLVIPNALGGKPVTAIGDGAFDNSDGACGVTGTLALPASLVSIGAGAFAAGAFSGTLTLPGNLTTVGSRAFAGCAGFEGMLVIPSAVRSVGEYAFDGCSFAALRFQNGNETLDVGEHAFAGSTIGGNLRIPARAAIGAYAFSGCTVGGTLELEDGVQTIGSFAFAHCGFTGSLRIPNSVTTLGAGAFMGCSFNGTLTLPTGITEIPAEAFSGCGFTGELNLPTDVAGIGLSAFADCAGFDKILYLPADVTSIAAGAFTGTGITDVYIRGDAPTVGPRDDEPSFPAEATVRYSPARSGWTIEDGRWQGYAAEPLTLTIGSADHRVRAGGTLQLATSYVIAGAPIAWRVTNGTGTAGIDDNGLLTGITAGTVTVHAEAGDDSLMTAENEFTVMESGVVISGETALYAGKSTTLTASFLPGNSTGTTVAWALAPQDQGFATVTGRNATCVVKAAAVTHERSITVIAAASDRSAATATHVITLTPLASAVRIRRDGNDVTGQTIPFDLNDNVLTDMTFAAFTQPDDALQRVSWKSSDTRGRFAAYTTNPDGTFTVSAPTGVAGIATLTATADDGSRKLATVKVQFAKLASAIEITGAPAEVRGGTSFQLGNTVSANRAYTDKAVLWWVNDEAAPYVTVTGGRVATKPVPHAIPLSVTAMVKATGAHDTADIMLRPAVTEAVISARGAVQAKNALLALDLGRTLSLTGTLYPVDAASAVKWSSSNARVATVNAAGTVTPVAKGTTVITFAALDGSRKSTTVKVQVGALAEDVAIDNPPSELVSKKSVQLKAAVAAPDNATNKGVAWRLENPADAAYATVTAAGRLTAKAVYENHSVTLVAFAKDGGGAHAACTVIIKPARSDILTIEAGGANVTAETLPLQTGETMQLAAYTLGVAEAETVAWKSSSPAVASVDASTGHVTALKRGTVSITATAADRRTASMKIVIGNLTDRVEVAVKGGLAATVAGGKRLSLIGTAYAGTALATNKGVKWSLANPADAAYAAVSASGVLTAEKSVTAAHTVTVKATAADGTGVTGSIDITVRPPAQSIVIRCGGYEQTNRVVQTDIGITTRMSLTASVYPASARQDVTWGPTAVRGAGYVTSDGVLHLNKPGTITVTAKANDGSGKTASFKVIVRRGVQGLAIVGGGVQNVRPGARLALKCVFTPAKPTNVKVSWSIDQADAAYATITASGVLTAKKVTDPCTVLVTARAVDNSSAYATVAVRIRPG